MKHKESPKICKKKLCHYEMDSFQEPIIGTRKRLKKSQLTMNEKSAKFSKDLSNGFWTTYRQHNQW